MEEYKLTIRYEAPDHQQAIKLAEDATDALPLLDHTLQIKIDMGEDPPVWDDVEA
jgi:hypothetical protein